MNIQTRSHRYLSSRGTILSTSRDVFLRHGFTDTSMDTIAQRSGVSKTTLYAHFESKEALFNQVVVDAVLEHGDDAACLFDLPAHQELRARLVTLGCRITSILLNPEAVALIRLCVVEGTRMPRLSCEALATARSNLLEATCGFFAEQGIAPAREAAELFIVLTMRNLQLEAMLPWSDATTADGCRQDAERVADLMLRLYGK
ncbi:TetR/AcrR family transcriptional regulator [Lichenicoccus sp.]|uniref:TetR/AcrR family transcriptional regulator n=1 Tax=Lichenicoccus sp. TaxID=2781899 RepID=UPI003D12800E